MKTVNVLIADDEKIVREGLARYVDWDAYNMNVIGTAENGRIALEMIDKERVDLLITDIHMPEIDGMALIAHLERRENAPLVILISGFSDFSYAQRGIPLATEVAQIIRDRIMPWDAYALLGLKPLDFDRIDIILNKMRDKISREYSSVRFPVLDESEWKAYTGTHASAILNSQNEIIDKLETGDVDEALELFERAIEVCKTKNQSYNFISRYCIDLSLNICEFALDNVGSVALLGNDPVGEISRFSRDVEVYEYVRNLMLKADKVMRKIEDTNISAVVQSVLNNINNNYSDFSLTLNSIADDARVSASYLSNRFKEEVGINFIKYLNGLRIKKAKELLHDITLKVFMVSDRVGYEDVRYFSRIFRKYTGYTPTEYQKKVTLW